MSSVPPPASSASAAPALTLDDLRLALARAPIDVLAAQGPLTPAFRGVPPPAAPRGALRDGAALLYAFPSQGRLWFPLTLRRDDLAEHRGQVSLPGGRPEPGEDLWQAALREAREEVGLDVPEIERLGVLAPVYIPVSHTTLHVHVACGPAPGELIPEPGEVARLELAALDDLLDPSKRRVTTLSIRGAPVNVPVVDLAGLEVWGATAMALSELAERLRNALTRVSR